MTQPYRIASGGMIDRSTPLSFTFNGKTYEGYRGDTLASALLANGVHLVARSFKYHRPRGIVSAGPEEPCALVRVGEGARVKPNLPATLVELYDGLTAASINCWPSVKLDFGATINAFAGWFPAGFYYKTFMWPARAWMTYERFIRNAAGLGVAPAERDPDRYEKRFEHCDVLVVGGGRPASPPRLRRACAARASCWSTSAKTSAGSSCFATSASTGSMRARGSSKAPGRSRALPEVRVLARTTATGYYDHNLVTLVERVGDHLARPAPHVPRQRLWKVFASEVVIATGAIERPLVFDRNDVPGVMLAGAAQRYARQYAVKAGTRAVVFTNNDSGYEAARSPHPASKSPRWWIHARRHAAAADAAHRGVNVLPGHAVVSAQGRQRVSGVSVAQIDAAGNVSSGASRAISCDLVCLAGGWDPAVHLYSQSGGKLGFDEDQQCFVPGCACAAHARGRRGERRVRDCGLLRARPCRGHRRGARVRAHGAA